MALYFYLEADFYALQLILPVNFTLKYYVVGW